METETVQSHEGGEVFTVGDEERMMRFLLTGTQGGSYYAEGKELLIENAQVVLRNAANNYDRTIRLICEASNRGLPKNDTAVMAIALLTMAGQTPETRRMGWAAMPIVCRHGSHLEQFFIYCKAISGGKWVVNRGGRAAVAGWYNHRRGKDDKQAWTPLAYDVTKYQSRGGKDRSGKDISCSHRQIIRMYHPTPEDDIQNAIYKFVDEGYQFDKIGEVTPEVLQSQAMTYLAGVHEIQHLPKTGAGMARAIELIMQHSFPWEVIPSHFLNDGDVWRAISHRMPLTAMIRNLPKMTAVGVFAEGEWLDAACDRLTDKDLLKMARIHPINLLMALKGYQTGKNRNMEWVPSKQLVECLEASFDLAAGAVTPTNKTARLCVDTSGSMTHQIAGFTNLSAREVAAAMALVAYRTEPNFEIVGFSSSIQKDLPIQKTSTLSDVMSTILRLDATYTYCRLPITDAMTTKDDFDAFIFYTDSETADGNPLRQHNRDDNHPFSHYLSEYREQRVENAKIVVVAACATEFTLNDPSDVLGLDIAGFGTDVPAVISSFIGDVPEPKVPQPVETPTVQVPTPDHRKDVVTSPPPSTV